MSTSSVASCGRRIGVDAESSDDDASSISESAVGVGVADTAAGGGEKGLNSDRLAV